MNAPPTLTDRRALARNRRRADLLTVDFLHEIASDEVKDRLSMVNKTFNAPVVVTGHPAFWAPAFPDVSCVADDDVLALEQGAHDLIVHAMSLHWANDPVGQLIQCLRALRPDGLFLAVLFGGQTLAELRAALAQAETEVTGGLSPRIAPMAEIRDLGGLLQRAGFTLPVADSLPVRTSYENSGTLMRELRRMGEGNALDARLRHPTRRAVFARMDEIYRQSFAGSDGRIMATFELIFLLGWAPDPSQPKPLRPGSAQARLAEILNSEEIPLKD